MVRLRIPVLLALAALLLVVGSPSRAAAASCSGADKGPRQLSSKTAAKLVVCLVNEKRHHHGRKALKPNRDLRRAARGHTRQMQRSSCFSHTCPGEPSLAGRFQRANYLPCGCSWGAAENIAWGKGAAGSPRRIVNGWMGSSFHRSNILGPYDHVGVGVRWGSPTSRHAKAGTYTIDFGYKR